MIARHGDIEFPRGTLAAGAPGYFDFGLGDYGQGLESHHIISAATLATPAAASRGVAIAIPRAIHYLTLNWGAGGAAERAIELGILRNGLGGAPVVTAAVNPALWHRELTGLAGAFARGLDGLIAASAAAIGVYPGYIGMPNLMLAAAGGIIWDLITELGTTNPAEAVAVRAVFFPGAAVGGAGGAAGGAGGGGGGWVRGADGRLDRG
ncbi:MAG: hypothetical protein J0G29_04165 [Alphaproteobacteria bacterium]|nr:hypothetical protein [Alphaproteobacteria bacterium]OJV44994.1 MAG: hypothetical protein BGO28_05505 [Alphaproteobacteria bacterium 43-37]